MKYRSGYLLIIVLVLLIVMMTALTSIATRSMKTGQDASISINQLQHRVGIASCRDAFLAKAFFAFKDIDSQRLAGFESPSIEANYLLTESIVLGGHRFDLVLSDENSKVNLNAAYFHSGYQKVFQALQRSLPVDYVRAIALQPAANANRSIEFVVEELTESGETSTELQITHDLSSVNAIEKATASESAELMIPAFRSLGEVFNFSTLVGQVPVRQVQLEFTKTFTLWGSGQINVRRAPDTSILTQMETVIPPARAKEILKAIRNSRDLDLQAIVATEVASNKIRQRLAGLIGEDSYAFSLFIDVKSPQSQTRKMFTISPDIDGAPEIQEFVFQ